MAVDQTTKAVELCTRLANAADAIMRGLEEIAAVKDQKESSGVDFAAEGVAAKLAGSSLKHADGTDFNNVISSGVATTAFLEGVFHDDIFQKVRPGTR